MSKKKEPADQNNERVRQIGVTRIETIVEDLSPMQIEECKTRITELLDRQDEGKRRLKELAKGFKDVLAEVKSQLDAARNEVATAKRRTEVGIDEYLTKRNEVIRIRADTGEQIGASRTARPSELQEALPLDEGGQDEEESEAFDA